VRLLLLLLVIEVPCGGQRGRAVLSLFSAPVCVHTMDASSRTATRFSVLVCFRCLFLPLRRSACGSGIPPPRRSCLCFGLSARSSDYFDRCGGGRHEATRRGPTLTRRRKMCAWNRRVRQDKTAFPVPPPLRVCALPLCVSTSS